MHSCPGHSNIHFSRVFKFLASDNFTCFNVCFRESRIAVSINLDYVYCILCPECFVEF